VTPKDNPASSLRVEQVHDTELKCGNPAIEEDRKQISYGGRSILADVRIPKHKSCTLKRHFLGCLRQIVGLAEKLAANDRERFIWAGERAFLKQARKRNGKSNYSQRQVRYSLAIAESLGLLTPAKRVRHSVLRAGFIMEHHDSLTTQQGARCLLSLRPPCKPPRVRGQKRHDTIKAENASASRSIASAPAPIAFPTAEPISSTGSSVCLTDCRSDSRSLSLQASEKSNDKQNSLTDHSPKTAENVRSEPSNPVSPVKENPVNEIPADQSWSLQKEHFTCSLFALDDLDLKPRPKGDPIGYVCDALQRVSQIECLSDEEFDPEFLAHYQHRNELMWACNAAIHQLSEEPFEGRKSRARVMGLAMELLREAHKVDAPRGWLPAMKRLRTRSPELRSVVHRESNYQTEPCDVLTGEWLDFVDPNHCLRTLAMQKPELKELLVLAAERMGVPSCWLECRWYINAVMSCLRPIPTAILNIKDELDRRMAGCRGLKGASEELYRGYYPRVLEPNRPSPKLVHM
jgi:hypothetical protein